MTDDASLITGLSLQGLAVDRGVRRLFKGLSAELAPGEAVALTGANGAGKTSLLRAIAGLLRPSAGHVVFQGRYGPLDPDEARSSGLHFLTHQDGLKSARTAGEELDFWSAWLGGRPEGAAAAVETFSLKPLLSLDVRKLSAGQRRRLALARLAAAPRRLWLLDEPMAPLDAAMRDRFGAVMAQHLDSGGLILAAVHDPLPIPARRLDLSALAEAGR